MAGSSEPAKPQPTTATPGPEIDGGLLPLLWTRFSWRHAAGAPGQTLLLLTILSLGIAVYVSIRLANRAAVAGFEQFTDQPHEYWIAGVRIAWQPWSWGTIRRASAAWPRPRSGQRPVPSP